MSSNFGEHFWFSNIGISIQPYQHSEVLYLSLERLKLSLLLSLLVSVRGERLVWHLCPREGWETLNLDLSSHLVFLRVRSNVEILNKDDNSICQLSGRPSVELTTTSTLIITSAPRTIPVVTAPARTISREYFIIISLTNVL